MHQEKSVNGKVFSIFMMALAAILLTACSDNKTAVKTEAKATKVAQEEKEIKEETTEKSAEETVSKGENQSTEEPAVSYTAEKTLTLDELINRWNEIEPGALSGKTETMSVKDGILTGLGNLGGGDSFIFELNQKDNMIQQVSLNLTFPLPEEGGGLGKNIPHQITVLMDVLEPELRDEQKEEMLSTLLNSQASEVSVKEGRVTYTVRNGDDRFWLDATFYQN
ncbi:hypothetical protein V7182_00305 [Neobacillus drentensis]|uniref:hypothetical protein n=1 Tax=Neobacillus drentensis TaxID=220684 RepID=UPI002FFE01C6